LAVVQVIVGVRMRLRPYKTALDDRCLVLVHQSPDQQSVGKVSFWRQNTFEFVHQVTLNNAVSRVVFEKSHRFMAALTAEGSVEVWSMRGQHASHQWDLNFKSVSDI